MDIFQFPVVLYISNTLLSFMHSTAIILLMNALLQERSMLRRIPGLAAYSLLYSLCIFIFYALFEIPSWQLNLSDSLSTFIVLLLLCVFVFYPHKKKQAALLFPFALMVAEFVMHTANLFSLLLPDFIFDLPGWVSMLIVYFQVYGLELLVCWLIARFLQASPFTANLRALPDYPRVAFFVPVAYWGLNVFFLSGIDHLSTYYIVSILFLVAICLIAFVARDITMRHTIEYNNALILQQEKHLKTLESLQLQLRIVQHDYKNMIAGLYAQAEQGDTTGIKEYIETNLLNMDSAIQADIRQINQITQIQLPALKSLLLAKQVKAQQMGVALQLEVAAPVTNPFMAQADLIRTVGILLDNALEASSLAKKPRVVVMLLQEHSVFTIMVKNNFADKPDLAGMWKTGYSTKGSTRGLGLASYKQIISKYPNATTETRIDNDFFTQILTVAPSKKDKF